MIKYCANQGIFFSKTLSYCKDSANLGVVNQILTVLMIRDWHYHFFMIIWENLIYDQIIVTRLKKVIQSEITIYHHFAEIKSLNEFAMQHLVAVDSIGLQ